MNQTRRKYLMVAMVLLVAVVCMAQRPGYGGNTWQVQATLTSTPTSIFAMSGNRPPAASTTVWVCEGNVSATAGTAAKITITAGDSNSSWNGIAPLSPTAASHTTLWNASSALACEWMPSGMLVSSDVAGVYFKASGIY